MTEHSLDSAESAVVTLVDEAIEVGAGSRSAEGMDSLPGTPDVTGSVEDSLDEPMRVSERTARVEASRPGDPPVPLVSLVSLRGGGEKVEVGLGEALLG